VRERQIVGLADCVQGAYEGDVLEGLLECASSSGRFRTTSSSSVTFAVPSLSSCDIFPEIAGVVSASDSDTDVSEYVVHGRDYLHVGDLVFSPPQANFLRNSGKHSEDFGDASVVEMLNTLCYTTHDLTDMNNVVQNVVLDWQSGTACENSTTADQIVVKTEPLCGNTELNCNDDSLMNDYVATLPEGSQYEHGDVLEGLLEYALKSGHFQVDSSQADSSTTANEVVLKTEALHKNTEVDCNELKLSSYIATAPPEDSQYGLEGLLECVSKSSDFQTASLSPVTGNVSFLRSIIPGFPDYMFSVHWQTSV